MHHDSLFTFKFSFLALTTPLVISSEFKNKGDYHIVL